jgi:hypothetical protein
MHTEKILPRRSVPEYREEHDGIVMWDRRGIVVVWTDGHRTYLPWAVLRAACQCRECRVEDRVEEAAPTC